MHRLLLLVALLPVLAQAQAPAFGERVGDVLSAEARAYFGLFPDVEGFVEARGTLGRHDTMRVAIVTEAGEVEERLLLPEQGVALRQFLATFEQYPTAYLNPRWQIIRPFGSPDVPVPYVNTERATVEVEAGGHRFPGVVLLASDTLLVLQPEGVPYRWTADRALALPAETITRVRPEALGAERRRTAILGLGTLVGVGGAGTLTGLSGDAFASASSLSTLVIGAMMGYTVANVLWPKTPLDGTYAERQALLREREAFDGIQPYDLPALETLAGRTGSFPSTPAAPPPSRWQRWHRAYGWVSVGVVGPGRITDQGDPIVFDEFFVNRTPEQLLPREGIRTGFGHDTGLDLSARPLPWLRLGATVQKHDVPAEVVVANEESAYMEPGALRGYVEAILPSPRYRGFGVDLALGGGMESHRVGVTRETSGSGRPLPFTIEEEGSNLFLQGTLDLFIAPHVSVFARYTHRDLPTLSVDYLEERFDILNNPDDLAYYAEAHEVTFGYTEVTWGTRLHF